MSRNLELYLFKCLGMSILNDTVLSSPGHPPIFQVWENYCIYSPDCQRTGPFSPRKPCSTTGNHSIKLVIGKYFSTQASDTVVARLISALFLVGICFFGMTFHLDDSPP